MYDVFALNYKTLYVSSNDIYIDDFVEDVHSESIWNVSRINMVSNFGPWRIWQKVLQIYTGMTNNISEKEQEVQEEGKCKHVDEDVTFLPSCCYWKKFYSNVELAWRDT